MLRSWIVRETGENRCPKFGEWYDWHGVRYAMEDMNLEYPILSVTPLPDNEQEESRCADEWDRRYGDMDSYSIPGYNFREGWHACYDWLTGHKEETKPVGEMTKAERRRWIYG